MKWIGHAPQGVVQHHLMSIDGFFEISSQFRKKRKGFSGKR